MRPLAGRDKQEESGWLQQSLIVSQSTYVTSCDHGLACTFRLCLCWLVLGWKNKKLLLFVPCVPLRFVRELSF